MFEIGKRIEVEYNDGVFNKVFKGEIVMVIKPGQVLTDEQLLKYTNLRPSSRSYKSVRGEQCNKRRIVLKMKNGHAIIPINQGSGRFQYKEIK